MHCFVITPFDSAFDDVYATIRLHVEAAGKGSGVICSRLDESRPAGRITDRLLNALRESSFCVADLTGCNPNVMWETGYAMALGKPVILITQDVTTLPFDIRDVQAIAYDRGKLYASLGQQLQDVVRDTVALAVVVPTNADRTATEEHARSILGLSVELSEIKEMVGQIVATWKTSQSPVPRPHRVSPLRDLEGAWFNEDSKSHIYIRIIENVVVAPYCYGDNDELTAYYHDWQEMGDYLFARFKWVVNPIRGFTFLKLVSPDTLQGAWWYDDKIALVPDKPLVGSGKSVTWRRVHKARTPEWASSFFAQVVKQHVPDFRGVPHYFEE